MAKKYKHSVSATELATLGKCERMLVLNNLKGKSESKRTRIERIEGNLAHAKYDRDVRKYAGSYSRDKRCFIATSIYGGNAWQTEILREWRDNVLLKYALGWLFVKYYYAISPFVVNWISSKKILYVLTRKLLDRIIKWIT